MRIKTLLLTAVMSIAVGMAGCKGKSTAQTAQTPSTLNVFAAASLSESFKDLGRRFEGAHPGTSVVFNFAGSQQLREQLGQGAPADVFASANRKEMDAASAAGLVDSATVRTFVRNRLVVIYPKDNRAKVAALADLGRSGIKIDIADPAVPVGKYTAQMLDQMSRDGAYGSDFKAKVLANVVSREDNVKSVVTKIRLGEADAGVVYVTDVSGEALKDVSTLAIPDPFNQTAEYPIGVAAKSQQAVAAAQFVTYVLSAEGQTVLKGYGFIPAGTAATTMPSP